VLTGAALSEADEERCGFEARPDDAERVVLYNPQVPIETFDLVIIDECHHSVYDAWRPVLDYFDAFTVGLTAAAVPACARLLRQQPRCTIPCERAVATASASGTRSIASAPTSASRLARYRRATRCPCASPPSATKS